MLAFGMVFKMADWGWGCEAAGSYSPDGWDGCTRFKWFAWHLCQSFVYSIWALAVCHKGRKMEIPFVPFLLVGMMLQLWWQCMS